MNSRIKELRYQVMLALYLPILLYSFSTFDLDEDTVVFEELEPVLVTGEIHDTGEEIGPSSQNGDESAKEIRPGQE